MKPSTLSLDVSRGRRCAGSESGWPLGWLLLVHAVAHRCGSGPFSAGGAGCVLAGTVGALGRLLVEAAAAADEGVCPHLAGAVSGLDHPLVDADTGGLAAAVDLVDLDRVHVALDQFLVRGLIVLADRGPLKFDARGHRAIERRLALALEADAPVPRNRRLVEVGADPLADGISGSLVATV